MGHMQKKDKAKYIARHIYYFKCNDRWASQKATCHWVFLPEDIVVVYILKIKQRVYYIHAESFLPWLQH